MRSLVALMLVASVLQAQLAVGCHCQHEFDCESHSADAAEHCYWHGDDIGGHVHHVHHSGNSAEFCDEEHPIPAHHQCDGCPECKAADPVGLRMEASSELDISAPLTVWVSHPIEGMLNSRQISPHRQSPSPDGPRSLLACGTLLRI